MSETETPKVQPVRLNLFDRIIMKVSPRMGMDRIRYRAAYQNLSEQGLVVAGQQKPTMRGWGASANNADADIIPKLEGSRASSRDLFMNTPLATGALRRDKLNVIGFGLRLQSRIDNDVLGLEPDIATAWERAVEREFFSWASNAECDSARTLAFDQLVGLAYFSFILSGDCFILLPSIPRIGQLYNLRVKIIEADYCSNPLLQFDTKRIAGGVEVDEDGAPIAYHFRKESMDAFLGYPANASDTWERILAYGPLSGRRQVLHIFEKERPGQRRGIPMLGTVVEELKSITRLSKAELQAAIINAFFTVFIKTTTPTGVPFDAGFIPSAPGLPPGSPGVKIVSESDARYEKIHEMGPGNVTELDQDQSIDVADPKRPNRNFEPFFMAIVKQIGSAINMPFEQLVLHFSASYSASRAALQEAWKHYRERRLWAARYICQPIYEEFLVEGILKGRIAAPGFFMDPVVRQAWCGALWSGPGQGQIDPLKETKAAVLRIQHRLSTHEQEYIALHGNDDWENSMTRLSREEQHLENLDLTTDPMEDVPDEIEENVTT